MYKNYLIIASKQDKAGINITTQLSQFRENPVLSTMKESPNFDFYLRDEDIISDENLNHEKISQYDFIIFASQHKSEKGGKTLSIHAPGNWRNADFGGQPGKVCSTSALFQKFMFEKLNETAKEHDLRDYKITLECTHHGPLINKPCLFIEVGSTETEWNDRRASFVLARTIIKTIKEFEENKYREVAIGIGGPHYCPNFNKIQLKSNVAISHIIPEYALPFTEEMLKEAIAKTQEGLDFVVLDWKGIGNADERQKIIQILEKNYISYKRTSQIEK